MINGVQIDNIVFLTESFAKKKQTNKKTNTNKINKANLQEKKQTNNTYQFQIPRHQKYLRRNKNEWNTKLSEQKIYIHIYFHLS